MELIDFIVIGIIAVIVGAAVSYIIKAKKSGKGCIGCPDSASCHSRKKEDNSSSCTSCHSCPYHSKCESSSQSDNNPKG